MRTRRRPKIVRGACVALCAAVWGVCAWGLTVAGGVSPAWGRDLRIGTRTQLSHNVSVNGTQVTVDGHLRDNLGQGIEGETIRVDFEKVTGAMGTVSRDVRTDRTGRFFVTLRLAPGAYEGSLRYSGRQFYYDSAELEVNDEIVTERGRVELTISAPRMVMHDAGRVAVAVAATSGSQPVPKLPLEIMHGSGELTVARHTTGDQGTARFTLPLDPNDGPQMAVHARFPGSKEFTGNRAVATIRILDSPELTAKAEAVRARLQRGVLVRGTLTDRHGPVQKQRVDVVLSQLAAEVGRFRAETDEDGVYEIFVTEDRYEAGRVTAEASARLPGGVSLSATMVSVAVDKTGLGATPWLLLGLIGVAGLAMGVMAVRDRLAARRKRGAIEGKRAPELTLERARKPRVVPITEGVAPPDLPQDSKALAGVLWDGQTGAPIQGGSVDVIRAGSEDAPVAEVKAAEPVAPGVITGEDGVFRLGPLEAGRYRLRAMRRGYVTAQVSITLPHRGELRFFRLTMTPVRAVVRDVYARLVRSTLRDEAAWGKMTPRQVSKLLVAAVEAAIAEGYQGPGDGLEAFQARVEALWEVKRGEREALTGEEAVSALVAVLEEVYYSQRAYDEEVIVVAEGLAKELRRRARGGGAPRRRAQA